MQKLWDQKVFRQVLDGVGTNMHRSVRCTVHSFTSPSRTAALGKIQLKLAALRDFLKNSLSFIMRWVRTRCLLIGLGMRRRTDFVLFRSDAALDWWPRHLCLFAVHMQCSMHLGFKFRGIFLHKPLPNSYLFGIGKIRHWQVLNSSKHTFTKMVPALLRDGWSAALQLKYVTCFGPPPGLLTLMISWFWMVLGHLQKKVKPSAWTRRIHPREMVVFQRL